MARRRKPWKTHHASRGPPEVPHAPAHAHHRQRRDAPVPGQGTPAVQCQPLGRDGVAYGWFPAIWMVLCELLLLGSFAKRPTRRRSSQRNRSITSRLTPTTCAVPSVSLQKTCTSALPLPEILAWDFKKAVACHVDPMDGDECRELLKTAWGWSRRALALTVTTQVNRCRKHACFGYSRSGCSRCPPLYIVSKSVIMLYNSLYSVQKCIIPALVLF